MRLIIFILFKLTIIYVAICLPNVIVKFINLSNDLAHFFMNLCYLNNVTNTLCYFILKKRFRKDLYHLVRGLYKSIKIISF